MGVARGAALGRRQAAASGGRARRGLVRGPGSGARRLARRAARRSGVEGGAGGAVRPRSLRGRAAACPVSPPAARRPGARSSAPGPSPRTDRSGDAAGAMSGLGQSPEHWSRMIGSGSPHLCARHRSVGRGPARANVLRPACSGARRDFGAGLGPDRVAPTSRSARLSRAAQRNRRCSDRGDPGPVSPLPFRGRATSARDRIAGRTTRRAPLGPADASPPDPPARHLPARVRGGIAGPRPYAAVEVRPATPASPTSNCENMV